ncbi:MAG TPA: TIGR04552 family protein [Deltaproteobacteria bacterium]|nr:TIGR04552 family protein [Deltaproteobacteria bacterium]
MRRDILEIDSSWSALPMQVPIHLQDVESLRVLLSGESVIDWQRLALHTEADVDRFLATHRLDVSDPVDRERLRYVFNESVSYLEEHLRLRFPSELRDPDDVRRVFVWASQRGGFRRTQILSCVIVKLMHVINHMEAADLKFRLPVSEAQYLDLAHRRILEQAQQMQEMGLPTVAFYGSRKSRSSVITKLLAKEQAVAATIFDKLRYRVVVREHGDIAPTLAWLSREVFPFNYVIPGESHNNLLDPNELVRLLSDEERREAASRPIQLDAAARNEFSGASYRAINWIVDYPVRIPESVENRFVMELGRVVYVNVEFQLLDEETSRRNERGENAHSLYKARQHRRVAARLKRGASGLDEP